MNPPVLTTFGSPSFSAPARPDAAAALRKKDLALLVYLVLGRGRAYSRAHLATLLWAESPEERARHSLTQAVRRIRAALGSEAVATDQDTVAWRGEIVCDALTLEEEAGGSGAGGPSVLETYRGDFLAGFSAGPGARDFEDWADARRLRYRTTALELLEREARKAAAAEDWNRTLALGQRGVEVEPEWEAGHRWIMRAWAALGERNQALKQFERLSGWLREELEAEPDPETAALADEIRARTPPPAPPRATPPPPPAPREAAERTVPDPSATGDGPSPPLPPRDAPPAPVSPPARRRRHPVLIAGLAAVVLLAAYAIASALPGRGAAPAEAPEPAIVGAPDAPACGAGEATARVVEEAFYFGVRVAPGRPFGKVWVVQNTGDCTWTTDYVLQHHASEPRRFSATLMGIPLDRAVRPGETYTFTVPMKAPGEPGTYDEAWRFLDHAGEPVAVGDADVLVSRIVVPQPHYPVCDPGEGVAAKILAKYPGTQVKRAGDAFRYSWTIRNTGECTWSDATRMRIIEGAGPRVSRADTAGVTRAVEPGQTYTFLVPMRAPVEPGVHREVWTVEDRGHTIPVDGQDRLAAPIRVLPPDVPASQPRLCLPGEGRARFVDENVPDSTVFQPGEHFTKRWTIVNGGECAWRPDYRLGYRAHTGAMLSLSQDDLPFGEVVPPGGAYTLEVPMRAPPAPGFYREDWNILDQAGNVLYLGAAPFVAALIVVREE